MASSIREKQEFYISRMTEHDLVDVVAIEEACGLSRWGWEAYHAELARERRSVMLVARLENESNFSTERNVKGFIAARLVADELHINNFAIQQAYRRLGVATKLLQTALEEAARMGARLVFLEVRAGNAPAQALYGRCGFRIVGRRPSYYTQPTEDALVMSLAISSSA
jgi:ribosomal-protein-alanine N-acetyltransferase